MADNVPEMLFQMVEISGQIRLVPYYFRNDYVGVEQYSRLNQDGVALVRPRLLREHQQRTKNAPKAPPPPPPLPAKCRRARFVVGQASRAKEDRSQSGCANHWRRVGGSIPFSRSMPRYDAVLVDVMKIALDRPDDGITQSLLAPSFCP